MTKPANVKKLPALLAEIAGVVGFDAMAKIARARGGSRCGFPANVGPDHWLSQLIGHDQAAELCRHIAPGSKGIELELPMGPFSPSAERRAELDGLILAGSHSMDTIARRLRTTRRSVARRIAQLKKAGKI